MLVMVSLNLLMVSADHVWSAEQETVTCRDSLQEAHSLVCFFSSSSVSRAGISGNVPYLVCFHLFLTQGDDWSCLQAFDSFCIFLLGIMIFPLHSLTLPGWGLTAAGCVNPE